MPRQMVWVGVVTHRHGTSIWVNRTEDGLYRALALQYVEEWLDEVEDTDHEIPKALKEGRYGDAVRKYFDLWSETLEPEFLTVETAPLD